MTPAKRKPVSPRSRKTVQKLVYVSVSPWALGWQIKVNGKRVSRFARQHDAELCANFLAGLMAPASVKIHGRNGRIKREETFNSAHDPSSTPG